MSPRSWWNGDAAYFWVFILLFGLSKLVLKYKGNADECSGFISTGTFRACLAGWA
jgi:hypothetical protein